MKGLFNRNPKAKIEKNQQSNSTTEINPQFYGFQNIAEIQRPLKFQFWAIGAIIAISGIMTALGMYWTGYYLPKQKIVSAAYFEIKVIDPSGHPVAGASVFNAENKVGTTDSFGEWRKFMPVRPGSVVAISIKKNTPEGTGRTLSVVKNLAVPLSKPKNSDMEITGTVELAYEQHSPAQLNTGKLIAANDSLQNKQTKQEVKTAPVVETYDRIALELGGAINKAWSLRDRSLAAHLKTSVITEIKNELSRQGIAVDAKSPWKLTLQHMSTGDRDGLIYVKSEFSKNGQITSTSFLRNYLFDAKETASGLIAALKMHIAKPYNVFRDGSEFYAVQPEKTPEFWKLTAGQLVANNNNEIYQLSPASPLTGFSRMKIIYNGKNPCEGTLNSDGTCVLKSMDFTASPPRADWKKFNVRVIEAENSGSEIFVSGYRAQNIGQQTWQFWAAPEGTSNLTVVRNNNIALRTKIPNSAVQTPVVSIPLQTIARRDLARPQH